VSDTGPLCILLWCIYKCGRNLKIDKHSVCLCQIKKTSMRQGTVQYNVVIAMQHLTLWICEILRTDVVLLRSRHDMLDWISTVKQSLCFYFVT